jgi:SIT4-associating protein SAP185/190
MLQGGNSLTVGVGIVIEVIRKNNSDYDPENVGGPDALPSIYDPIYLGTLLRQFAKHIPDFMSLILSSKHSVIEGGQKRIVDRGQLNSAWGTKIEPLGFDRFKTCELMAELLHCSNMGLLNEVGSEDYIRQRDAERERLQLQGAFDHHKKDESGIDYNDPARDFANGSALDSRSSRDPIVLEVTNAGEDDGFEDVGSSGVLLDGAREDVKDAKEVKEAEEEPQKGLVDEPLAAPDNKLDAGGETSHQLVPPPSQTPPVDPVSPTACGLTEKVGEIKIDAEEPASKSQSAPQESADSTPVGSTTGHQQSPDLDSTALSPHPEDKPAPLFGSHTQSEPQISTLSDPVSVPSSEIPQPSEQELPQSIPADTGRPDDEFAPQIQYDLNGQPVVGDYLKIMFVENKVVPTILVRTSSMLKNWYFILICFLTTLGFLLSVSLEQFPA